MDALVWLANFPATHGFTFLFNYHLLTSRTDQDVHSRQRPHNPVLDISPRGDPNTYSRGNWDHQPFCRWTNHQVLHCQSWHQHNRSVCSWLHSGGDIPSRGWSRIPHPGPFLDASRYGICGYRLGRGALSSGLSSSFCHRTPRAVTQIPVGKFATLYSHVSNSQRESLRRNGDPGPGFIGPFSAPKRTPLSL